MSKKIAEIKKAYRAEVMRKHAAGEPMAKMERREFNRMERARKDQIREVRLADEERLIMAVWYYQDAKDFGAACDYYGADRPENMHYEDEDWRNAHEAANSLQAYKAQVEVMGRAYREHLMDRMMAGEVQPGGWVIQNTSLFDDDIPF